MENYFIPLFEDVRHERSLILLLSVTDEGILKQSGFTINYIKLYINYIALEKIHRQKMLKEYYALQLSD